MASDKAMSFPRSALRRAESHGGLPGGSQQTSVSGTGTSTAAAAAGCADGVASPYDSGIDYLAYWAGRTYEHRAEVMALSRLLRGRSFSHAVDVGGGFGRISVVLRRYADRVTIADPSTRQLELAQRYLKGQPGVQARLMDAAHLDFDDASIDLAVMVRLLHHLPDPADALAETARILRPGGYAVIEAANVLHGVNRLRSLARRGSIGETAVDIRSAQRRQQGGIPFVNHHPERLMLQLAVCGLQVERVLSVSNLRSPVLKSVLPRRLMLAAEYALQAPLAAVYFGPSLFFLARKQDLADRTPSGRDHDSLARCLSRPA